MRLVKAAAVSAEDKLSVAFAVAFLEDA